VLVLLCVSVLAGFGLTFLLAQLKERRKQYFLTALLSGAVLLEVLLPSFNVDLAPPEVYVWLADQPGDFVVAELPPRSDHSDLLYQRVHQKRLFNPSRENAQELLYSLVDQERFSKQVIKDVAMFPDELKEVGVKYVIFHKGDPIAPLPDDYLDCVGFKLIKEFDDDLVFEIVGKRADQPAKENP